jgi:hypothetical protein
MGMRHSLHIGPYIRCSTKTKARTEERLVCSKQAEHAKDFDSKKFKFCPVCGAEAKKVTVETGSKVNEVDYEDVVDAIGEDVLCEFNGEYADEGVVLYVGNQNRGKERDYRAGGYDSECGEILTGNATDMAKLIKKEIEHLSTSYAEEIAKLRTLYGSENVEVRWGALGEIS